jgi:hypothetical protein
MEAKDAIHQEPYIAFPMSSTVTLRDWFAGQVLAGQISYEGAEGCDAELVAGCAYELADAMMKARGKQPCSSSRTPASAASPE